MSGVAEPRVGVLILSPGSGVLSPAGLVPDALLPTLSAFSSPGLALMMQLARELKTLARDLSVALVVRKWTWLAILALPLVPGLHQVGRCSFKLQFFISLKEQLLNPQSGPLGKDHSPTSLGHLEHQTGRGSDLK